MTLLSLRRLPVLSPKRVSWEENGHFTFSSFPRKVTSSKIDLNSQIVIPPESLLYFGKKFAILL